MPSSRFRWICISIFLVWYLWLFDINGNVSTTSKRFLAFDFVNVRPFPVAERWAELVLKEFALQGDEEKVGNSNGWQQEEAGWNLPHKQGSKQLAIERKDLQEESYLKILHTFFPTITSKRKKSTMSSMLVVGCLIHQWVFIRTDLSSGLGHSCGPIERQEDGEYATVTGGDDCHRWRMTFETTGGFTIFLKNQLDVKRRACFSVRKV